MGRSFKYHRPRGPLSASSEEPNALVTLRAGACAQPHARATVAELWDGLTARRQNHVGLLGFDAMVSRKKDSIGAVMSRREDLAQDSRRLVGLQPGDPAATVVPGSHLFAEGAPQDIAHDQSWIASACFSPHVGRSIGLGLLENGADRMGEAIVAAKPLEGISAALCVVPALSAARPDLPTREICSGGDARSAAGRPRSHGQAAPRRLSAGQTSPNPSQRGKEPRMPQQLEDLQERIAHLQRAVDDLSETVARQDKDIALLQYRVQLLMEREAARESDGGGGVVLGDERPPHY